jgi:SAM-dependent methyltransferase
MGEYEASTYGDRIAGIYDAWYASCAEGMIDRLAELAGDGPALELGIGTGRVALPLAERGVAVHGIDASTAMVEQLRAKPGGAAIPVTLGDFGRMEGEGRYRLVYVVFNTFFGLLSQEEQVACFRGAAARLTADGAFLLEVFVPDPCRFTRGQNVTALPGPAESVHLAVSQHDPVEQRSTSHHVILTEAGIRLYPVQVRYAWPAELDLMAQLAGLRLRHRWGGWKREPFTRASQNHVSVYERA